MLARIHMAMFDALTLCHDSMPAVANVGRIYARMSTHPHNAFLGYLGMSPTWSLLSSISMMLCAVVDTNQKGLLSMIERYVV
jgi:hypothetical protein